MYTVIDLSVYLSSVFESELSSEIPVVKASLGGTRLIGRMSVGMYLHALPCIASWWFLGNKNGLLLPVGASDQGLPYESTLVDNTDSVF